MAKEILAIPEEYLEDVISVIRIGLEILKIGLPNKNERSLTVIRMLEKWCNEEQEYIERWNDDR